MELLRYFIDNLKEAYGADVAFKAIFTGAGLGLIAIALMLKTQQPIVIINEIKNNEEV